MRALMLGGALLVALMAVSFSSHSLFTTGGSSDFSPSDARLKRDVEPFSPERGLDVVLALEPVGFSWSDEEIAFPQGGRVLGFIAQEVAPVLPEVVEERGGFLYVGYDQLSAVLVAATQRQQQLLAEQAALLEEQQLEIDELRARLDALEAGR